MYTKCFLFRNDPHENPYWCKCRERYQWINGSRRPKSSHVNEFPNYRNIFSKIKVSWTRDLVKIVHANAKVNFSHCFIATLKSLITGVRFRGLAKFELLVNSAKELFWYPSPHAKKLAARKLHLAATFRPHDKLNNPKRHGHKVPDINQEVLVSLVDAVNSHLEKSYVTRTNFKPVKNVLSNIIEICVK